MSSLASDLLSSFSRAVQRSKKRVNIYLCVLKSLDSLLYTNIFDGEFITFMSV